MNLGKDMKVKANEEKQKKSKKRIKTRSVDEKAK